MWVLLNGWLRYTSWKDRDATGEATITEFELRNERGMAIYSLVWRQIPLRDEG